MLCFYNGTNPDSSVVAPIVWNSLHSSDSSSMHTFRYLLKTPAGLKCRLGPHPSASDAADIVTINIHSLTYLLTYLNVLQQSQKVWKYSGGPSLTQGDSEKANH